MTEKRIDEGLSIQQQLTLVQEKAEMLELRLNYGAMYDSLVGKFAKLEVENEILKAKVFMLEESIAKVKHAVDFQEICEKKKDPVISPARSKTPAQDRLRVRVLRK